MNKVREFWWKFRIRSLIGRNSYDDVKGLNPLNRRCFVCLAADYGNLGDVAITYAQEKYLKQKYPDCDIIDWPISRTVTGMHSLKSLVRPGDIITIVGGGNMGDLYFDIELCRLMIVRAFPKNEIICFPQTIIYSDSKEAKFLKRLSKKIYGNHKKLTLQAREERSYRLMQSLYPNVKVEIKPDIVLSLDEREPAGERKGVLLCLRNDKEKAITPIDINELIAQKGLSDREIRTYDTHINKNYMPVDEREKELSKIWQAFRSSELVVTDRLHGMIFAYITSTPAIVLPNNNHKIGGCYEWIKDCKKITMFK